MIKKILKWGNGMGIYFDAKEIDLYGFKIGDKIDLSDMFLTQVKIEKEGSTYKRLPKNQSIRQIKQEVKK